MHDLIDVDNMLFKNITISQKETIGGRDGPIG
jgi:hypothetical protein